MPSSSQLLRIQQIVAGAMAVILVGMAYLAGRHLKFGDDVILTHGYIGNAVFVLALVNLAASFKRDAHDGPALALAGALALLTFAQVGLGYVARDSLDASTIHIPNGVLLMGLSAYQFGDLRHRRRASHGAAA